MPGFMGYPNAKRRRGSAAKFEVPQSAAMSAIVRSAKASRRLLGLPSMVHAFQRAGDRVFLQASGNAGVLPTINTTPGGGTYLGGVITQLSTPTNGPIVFDTMSCGGSFAFHLRGCSTATELTSLYDQYRIKAVDLKLTLTFNQAPSVATASGQPVLAQSLPTVHYCVDYDDRTPPTSISSVLDYSNVKSVRFGATNELTIRLRPRAQNVITADTAGVSAAGGLLPADTWLDTSSPAVPHNGIKFWIENLPVGANVGGLASWGIVCTPMYYLEMKNVK